MVEQATRAAIVPKRIQAPEGKPLRLDLGCGDNKAEGYYGIDIAACAAVDYTHDLNAFPWPIDDATVDEIRCSHFFEHLTGAQRIRFMEECFRVLKAGAKMAIAVPHHNSNRAIQDPTHQWPPVCEQSFLYFNAKWMEDNKLQHYGIKCDFDFSYGYSMDPDVAVRNAEYQQYAIKHLSNSALDLHVTLTKRG